MTPGPDVMPYTMKKAGKAAEKRNKKAAEKAPLLAIIGETRIWTPQEVFDQATLIGNGLEKTLIEFEETETKRISVLKDALLKAVSPETIIKWELEIKRIYPPDLVYTSMYLFKRLAEVDPPIAWQLCLHQKDDRHIWLGLHYHHCPVCQNPLNQRKAIFHYAAYLLANKRFPGYLFDNSREILIPTEQNIFVNLCNRLWFEMKSPTPDEIEMLLMKGKNEISSLLG